MTLNLVPGDSVYGEKRVVQEVAGATPEANKAKIELSRPEKKVFFGVLCSCFVFAKGIASGIPFAASWERR